MDTVAGSIVALASMFMGVVPLAMGIVYVIWPSEHRLALMRPLSLATIFAASVARRLVAQRPRGIGRSQESASQQQLARLLQRLFLSSSGSDV